MPGLEGWPKVRLNGCAVEGAVLVEGGAVKVRVPGLDRLVYVVPERSEEQPASSEHLRRVLGDWLTDVAVSGNIVVLRTPPGCAHVIASALDRSELEASPMADLHAIADQLGLDGFRRLRKAVDEGFEPPLIHTVRGVGYKIKA